MLPGGQDCVRTGDGGPYAYGLLSEDPATERDSADGQRVRECFRSLAVCVGDHGHHRHVITMRLNSGLIP